MHAEEDSSVPVEAVRRFMGNDLSGNLGPQSAVMPSGLDDRLWTRDFVDFLGFLASLKPAAP